MPFTPSYCPRCATPMATADEHGTLRPTAPRAATSVSQSRPAAGVILVEHGRVLLVKRAWEPRAGSWCLPAGFMEAGGTRRQTAVRELEEETGVIAQLTGLFGVYAGFDDPRVRAVLILYTGMATGGEQRAGDDAIELAWYPLDQLPEDLAFASHRQAPAELIERLAGT
jgi:ADP-ribose pyrophosphatase YjhB (NUDIX family)